MEKLSLEPIYFVNENEICKKHLTKSGAHLNY
nr:MAG TPA: hypothetical protein [Bacteriophage sp.]